MILIHGGPIPPNLLTTPKDWGLFQSYGRLLGASGLAAITFNHCFFAPQKAADAMAEVRALLAHLHDHAETLRIDPQRLCLWAFSGGGIFLSPFLRQAPANIRCMVAYYAALHARLPEFSPATQVAESSGLIPPLLIARAGRDMPGLNEGTDHFIQQALKKNACLDVLIHPAGEHGFDIKNDDARTRGILRHTVEFLRTHLAADPV